VQDGRIPIGKINLPFLRGGGSPAGYGAGLTYAIENGWLWKHESGTHMKFTPAGADLFAWWLTLRDADKLRHLFD
jgi:hypothetical protein